MSDEYVIPSSPADRVKVKQAVEQISNAMDRARGEGEFIKATKERIKAEIGIPSKVMKKLAKDYNDQQFKQRQKENEEYEALYETVMNMTSNSVPEESEE